MVEKPPPPEDDSQESGHAETLVATDPLGSTGLATDPMGETVGASTTAPATGGMSTTLAPGHVIADTYEIEGLLGRGGMGVVWRASHRRLAGRTVAIKVLLHGGAVSEELLTRFRHEAEAAARIGHPHIVDVLDYNTLPSGEPYIVMEHLEGEPLSARLERGPMPVEEVLRVTRQIGLALHAAHCEGVVHRDLKPDNVFLCRTDGPPTVKVLDFGISKVRDSDTLKTADAVVMGTPCYMSPEQAFGKSGEVDARSDVFSLGAMVYEMLCGQRAFEGDGPLTTLYQIVHEDPAPLADLAPETPPHVLEAVDTALAKKPEARFNDMAAFISSLTGEAHPSDDAAPAAPSTHAAQALSTGPSGPSPLPEPRPPSPARSMMGFIVGGLVVGGLAILGWPESPVVEPAAVASPESVREPDKSAQAQPEVPAAVAPTPPPVLAGLCAVDPFAEPCSEGFVAWCALDGARLACCAPGLVPSGQRGACVCAPGGVSHQSAVDSGCVLGDAEAATRTIQDAIKRTRPAIQGCYERALSAREILKGHVVVSFSLTPTGVPVELEVSESGLPDADVQGCVLEAIAEVPFAPPVDGHTRVLYPFTFASKPRPKPSTSAPPKASKPDGARPAPKALVAAREALSAGRYREALRQARQSLFERKTSEAYVLMAKAHCRLKNLPDARGAIAKLRGASKRRVVAYCQKAGLAL